MSGKKIRFGIVGTGAIAHFHAIAINRSAGAALAAVCGRTLENTKAFAKQYGIEGYCSLDDFLASDIEAVTIAAPSGCHLSIGARAARYGKHVLCEKPLEVTSTKAARFIEVCFENGVQLGVFLQARFDRCTRLAKQAIAGGRLGRILLASCQMRWYRSQQYYDSAAWRGTWQLDGGGALMNQGIHTVDLLIHLVGSPLEVAAFKGPVTHQRIEVEDNLTAALRFAGGAIGTIEASTSCAPGFPRRIEISGEHGSITIEDNRIVRWQFGESQPDDPDQIQAAGHNSAGAGGAADPMAIDVAGHCMVLDDFISSVRLQRKPAIDGAEGKKAVDCVRAIYKSIETGKMVRVGTRP